MAKKKYQEEDEEEAMKRLGQSRSRRYFYTLFTHDIYPHLRPTTFYQLPEPGYARFVWTRILPINGETWKSSGGFKIETNTCELSVP